MSEYRKKIETTAELGAWYDRKYAEMGDGWATPAEECNRHLDDLGVTFDQNLRLLDVGCGAGHFLSEAEKRVSCAGTDISEVGVKLSRKRASMSTITPVSIENWDYWQTARPFDYIVSMGSLEHVVDIDKALDNIRGLLKKDGKFYFFCPNELWKHFDQPNERTMSDAEWSALFRSHGLYTRWTKRWNDSTVFCGGKVEAAEMLTGLNLGCGTRLFKSNDQIQWVNLDAVDGPGVDLVGDWRNSIPSPTGDGYDIIVAHHTFEHQGCGEQPIHQCYEALKLGGSLIVSVPDLRKLAAMWLSNELTTQIYMTNVYGPYDGTEESRHRWGFDAESLRRAVMDQAPWHRVLPFDWREIPGADIARDDRWILCVEAVK